MYTDTNDDYKDLKQEISFQLIKSYPKFKGDSKLSTWVYKVALFTALGYLRLRPKKMISLEGISDVAHENKDYDEWNQVFEQIKLLPEGDKTLVFLYLEDRSYKEIAEIMGLSESNVGVKLNRIKKKLKTFFAK